MNESYNSEETLVLFKACKENDVETARIAINNHADVNACNYSGDTPLHIACLFDHTAELLALLIKHQANPNAVNDNGETPLLLACATDHDRKNIQWLIQHTTEEYIDCCDTGSDTALEVLLTMRQDFDLALLMLAKGAQAKWLGLNGLKVLCTIPPEQRAVYETMFKFDELLALTERLSEVSDRMSSLAELNRMEIRQVARVLVWPEKSTGKNFIFSIVKNKALLEACGFQNILGAVEMYDELLVSGCNKKVARDSPILSRREKLPPAPDAGDYILNKCGLL